MSINLTLPLGLCYIDLNSIGGVGLRKVERVLVGRLI